MKILHLYHDLMNLYGEYANILVLKKHLMDQGVNAKIIKASIDDDINFNDYNFVYCGSGLESNLEVVLADMLKRKNALENAINNNVIMLFTGNAMELFGENALDILPYIVKPANKRITGDVILHNELFNDVVGFINANTIVDYKDDASLFKHVFKDNNLKLLSNSEGYLLNNLFVTHLIGPLLVKNPNITNFFVKKLLKKEGLDYKEVVYIYELDSYNTTLSELKGRIN